QRELVKAVSKEQDNMVTKEQSTPYNTRPETMDGKNDNLTTRICNEPDTKPYSNNSDSVKWLARQGELSMLPDDQAKHMEEALVKKRAATLVKALSKP
ncbi:12908_t:CDS:1, partial [Acaulospora morrowiae]